MMVRPGRAKLYSHGQILDLESAESEQGPSTHFLGHDRDGLEQGSRGRWHRQAWAGMNGGWRGRESNPRSRGEASSKLGDGRQPMETLEHLRGHVGERRAAQVAVRFETAGYGNWLSFESVAVFGESVLMVYPAFTLCLGL